MSAPFCVVQKRDMRTPAGTSYVQHVLSVAVKLVQLDSCAVIFAAGLDKLFSVEMHQNCVHPLALTRTGLPCRGASPYTERGARRIYDLMRENDGFNACPTFAAVSELL